MTTGIHGPRPSASRGRGTDHPPVRVVITHDFMETYGGAERVTQELAQEFPDAPVVALLGRRRVARRMGVEARFHSILPPRPGLFRHYRLLTPVFPGIVARTRLPEADVVLSSSYAFAHGLRTPSDAPRVCYCHSPLRFAWSMTESYESRWAASAPARVAFQALASGVRRTDRAAARGVRTYLTQSPFTAAQIERAYGRPAEVIGAPVDCDLFRPGTEPPADYYLLSGRLIEPYKRVTVALEAFRRLPDERLIVAGDGPALAELRAAAPPNVEFTGHLEDAPLVALMQRCRAAVFPSRDDFGLIPVEVMACGRPVVAYADGGALHTVVPGVTGEHFGAQTADALTAALRDFDPSDYDPAVIRRHAEQWDRVAFRARVREAVEAAAR